MGQSGEGEKQESAGENAGIQEWYSPHSRWNGRGEGDGVQDRVNRDHEMG